RELTQLEGLVSRRKRGGSGARLLAIRSKVDVGVRNAHLAGPHPEPRNASPPYEVIASSDARLGDGNTEFTQPRQEGPWIEAVIRQADGGVGLGMIDDPIGGALHVGESDVGGDRNVVVRDRRLVRDRK